MNYCETHGENGCKVCEQVFYVAELKGEIGILKHEISLKDLRSKRMQEALRQIWVKTYDPEIIKLCARGLDDPYED